MSPKITASSPSTTATEKSIIRDREWREDLNCKLPTPLEEEAERSESLIRGEIRERK